MSKKSKLSRIMKRSQQAIGGNYEILDDARKTTEKMLNEMEYNISGIYKKAAKGITKKWSQYMERAAKKVEKLQADYDAAKLTGDKNLIKEAGKKLGLAKYNVLLRNEYYQAMITETTLQLANVNKTALAYINNQIPDIYAVNYNAISTNAFNMGVDFSIVDAHTVKRLIKDHRIKLPPKKINIPKDMRWNAKQLNSAVLQGILQGESIPKISDRIYPIVNNNEVAAVRSARTMVTAAECHGRLDSYHNLEERGVVQKKVWIATPDDRTRDTHLAIDGEEVKLNDTFSNGCMFPGDGSGPPEEVWNCFPAETAIATDCDIISSYKRWYDGHLIKIKTANGVCFSCTPNHPILTSRGWIKANVLHSGDNLLVTFIGNDSVPVSWRNPNINHIFPRMDTFHKAFYIVFGERARDLTMNLNSDIPTADIEVVSQKRFLRVCRDSRIVKCLYKLMLEFSYAFLSCKSNFMERFLVLISSANSFMSGGRKCLTLFEKSSRHTQIHSFGTITRGDAALVKISDDNRTANPELFCKSFDRLPGVVFLDEIIDVQIDDFHGYVYNLQTDNNYYFVNSILSQNAGKANGIFAIAHNCRCSIRTHIIGFKRNDGSISKIDYQRGETLHDRQMVEERARRAENDN